MKKTRLILSIVFTALTCLAIGYVMSAINPVPGAWPQTMCVISCALFVGAIALSYGMPQTDLAFANACGRIGRPLGPNCKDPLVGGVEIFMWLMNKGDISTTTPNATNPIIIEGFTMKNKTVIPYGTLVGTFLIGEIVTGTTSAATGRVVSDTGTTLTLMDVTGVFTVGGEVLTGATSGATAVGASAAVVAAKAYKYEGIKASNTSKTGIKKGKYKTNFDHGCNFVVFDVSPTAKAELQEMANSMLVAVIEYKYKGTGGNAAFEIHGLDQGLEVSTFERDSENKDTEGAYAIGLKTPDAYSEPRIPRTFYITDYTASAAALNALL